VTFASRIKRLGSGGSGDSTQVMDQRMFVNFHETEAQRQMKRTEGRDEGRGELLSLGTVVVEASTHRHRGSTVSGKVLILKSSDLKDIEYCGQPREKIS